MNIYKKVLVVVLALVAFTASVGIAKALNQPSWFWEHVAKLTAEGLVEKMDVPSSDNGVVQGDFMVGAAGDTFSTQAKSQVLVTTSTESNQGTASTTFGLLSNNSGKDRLITALRFLARGTRNSNRGNSFDFSTTSLATNPNTSSTNPIYAFTYSTSTDDLVIITSTFDNQPWKRLWKNGEGVGCFTGVGVSTTAGYCEADYSVIN